MRHQRFARRSARPGEKAHHFARHSRFVQNIDEDRRNRRRIARRLHDRRVSCHDRRYRHPAHDRRRKIPRRNNHAYAQRNVLHEIFLAAHRGQLLRLAQTHHFAPVVFAEINQLSNIRIRFRPTLPHFVAQPGVQLVSALVQNVRRAIQTRHSLGHRHFPPFLKRVFSRFHRLLGHLHAGLLKNSYDLFRMRWVDGLDLVRRGDLFPADHQRILAPKHSFHLAQRVFHRFAVFRLGEIDERFVPKLSAL